MKYTDTKKIQEAIRAHKCDKDCNHCPQNVLYNLKLELDEALEEAEYLNQNKRPH